MYRFVREADNSGILEKLLLKNLERNSAKSKAEIVYNL